MTKKLEDFFNLPPSVKEDEEDEEIDIQHTMTEVTSLGSAITTAEKVDYALPTVVGLDSHDNEMDSISKKAMGAYEELMALGGNVPDMHAGKIYEVAVQALKTALDAKNSKADKKLKMIELQLKKVRAEQIDFDLGAGPARGTQGGEFDRNELLKYIVSSKNSENSDK